MIRRAGIGAVVVALLIVGVAPAFGASPYLAGTGVRASGSSTPSTASAPMATPVVGSAPAYLDSLGTEFWLTFPTNYYSGSNPDLSLFISGPEDTTGSVEIPGLTFTTPFSVTANQVTTVALPPTAQLSGSDDVSDLGVHVTAAAEVAVYGLNRIQYTTDAYLGLPVDILGTDYLNLGWGGGYGASEFGVVATQDGTTVTITPTATVFTHTAGTPYTVALDRGQTYQLASSGNGANDLTGSSISADKPIAVFGGNQCANIPTIYTGYCDHVVEQMTPTDTWGQHFAAMPLATRTGGDTFRVLASAADTHVTINGAAVATLQRGQFYEAVLTGPTEIITDQPVAVAQYSNGTTHDGVTSDPFEMLVAPVEQFLSSYAVSTPASGFSSNYINVVAPSDATGSITLDGTPVPSSAFTPIGSSGYSGAQLTVSLGSHAVAGSKPFGTFVYGYDSYDSYGYPGGMAVRPLCGEDGLDALHSTPLTGAISGVIHGSAEPVVGGVSPEVAGVVHEVNCGVVVPVEGALGG